MRYSLEKSARFRPPNSFFVSTIGDFAQDQTVFSKVTPTHWKPVMLISQEALKYFCYAIFYRDAQGYWFSYVRSFAPPSIADSLRVEIRIGRPGCLEVGVCMSATKRHDLIIILNIFAKQYFFNIT